MLDLQLIRNFYSTEEKKSVIMIYVSIKTEAIKSRIKHPCKWYCYPFDIWNPIMISIYKSYLFNMELESTFVKYENHISNTLFTHLPLFVLYMAFNSFNYVVTTTDFCSLQLNFLDLLLGSISLPISVIYYLYLLA